MPCSLAFDAALGLDDPLAVMHYEDRPRGISKRVRVESGKVVAARLTGETAAFDWLRDVIVDGTDAAACAPGCWRRWRAPRQAQAGRGRIVCNCLNVGRARHRRCDRGRRRSGRAAGHAEMRHRMRLVRAGTETADRRESGGGMSSQKDLIREEREGCAKKS